MNPISIIGLYSIDVVNICRVFIDMNVLMIIPLLISFHQPTYKTFRD